MPKFHPSTIKAVFFDADGVLHHGKRPVPGAVKLIDDLRASGRAVFVVTNNSSMSRRMRARHMNAIGFDFSAKEIITSAYMTALYFKDILRGSKKIPRIYLVGARGLPKELKALGVLAKVFTSPEHEGPIDYVVAGIDKTLTYRKVARAQHAIIIQNARFIATNNDPSLPVEHGFLPGAGASVAAIAAASSRQPDAIIGKPSPLSMKLALEIAGCRPHEAVMIGDRLDTDIAAANRAGIHSVLCLSGETKKASGKVLPEFAIKDVVGFRKILKLT